MKLKKLQKKLVLNKKTVVNLSFIQLRDIKGGLWGGNTGGNACEVVETIVPICPDATRPPRCKIE